MANTDPEWDGLTPQPPRPTDDAENNDSNISSESSESISERGSLLGKDNKQVGYGATEVRGEESDVIAESDGTTEIQKTPKAIAAMISVLLVGVFISNADGSLVLATYGIISSEFGAFGNASWLTTGFALSVCAIQPLTGKLSDIFGRKEVLVTSYVLFGIGCAVVGVAQSMWQVIAGRVISGLGAAGMTVIVSIVITDVVPIRQVAAWRSYVNVFHIFGRSVGGPLGGFLADTVGWRWSFLGQVPLTFVAILLVALKLSSSESAKPQVKGQPSKLGRVDFIGSLLLASTMLSLLGSLSLASDTLPWSHPRVIGLLLGSVVLASLFVVYEVKFPLEPVFPPKLLIQRDVAAQYLIIALQTAAQLSMMFSVPLYFRVTKNISNAEAGSHLLPAVLSNTFGSLLAGVVIQRTGRYKLLTILASSFASFSYFLLIIRWTGNTSWLESLEIMPSGFGMGLAFSATFVALQSSVKKEEVAISTGGLYTASAIGMVVGIAASSTVQLGTLRSALEASLNGFSGAQEIISEVISNVSSIAGLDEPVRTLVIGSYVKSLESSHMVSLGCSLVALLIALTIREHPLK
ncbi:MFS general substrate transporter [Hyaloscypha variabilis]